MRTPGVGGRTILKLLDQVGTPSRIFAESRRSLAALGLQEAVVDGLKKPDWPAVEQDLAWLAEPRRCLLTLHDPAYPPLLREIQDPPPLLFVLGDINVLSTPQLAMVGSRNPSSPGKRIARDFAASLARAGLTITSGLALGIDAASHQGALDAGGNTVAVAGTGLDRVYPSRHKDLAYAIFQQGALVSELPPGTNAKANHFPRRNRILSGLCLGTLVVEAAIESGSLITARQALDQGREVFAIPGSIDNPLARGCNALIRQGAKLVETARDVLEELPWCFAPANPSPPVREIEAELNDDHRNLLKSVAYAPTSVDTLVRETGLPPESISSMLLVLELHGFISSAAGGYYCRLK